MYFMCFNAWGEIDILRYWVTPRGVREHHHHPPVLNDSSFPDCSSFISLHLASKMI